MQLRSGKVFHSSASVGVDVNKNISKTDYKHLSDIEAANILLSIGNKQSSKVDISVERSNDKLNSLIKEIKLFMDIKIDLGKSNKDVFEKLDGFLKFYTYLLENVEEVLREQDFSLRVISLISTVRTKTYSFICDTSDIITKEEMKTSNNDENLQVLHKMNDCLIDSHYKLCMITDRNNLHDKLMTHIIRTD
jgi:hypothetical protein